MKILAADIGFTSTGMAIFEITGEGARLFDVKCLHTQQEHTERVVKKGKKVKIHLASVAHDDVRRTEFLACGIMNYFMENQCKGMICEIPNGGAQDAKAAKCMGAATGMAATIRVALSCPAIWVTPGESRAAAGWDKDEHPRGEMTADQYKKFQKAFVMTAMELKYPEISGLKIKDKEHIADACATFEAVKSQRLDKLMEVI